MTPELHDRLKELDRVGGWEQPPGLDRRTFEEIQRQKAPLEKLLGCPLKTDEPQDASYLAEFCVQEQEPQIVNLIVMIICIRFSAFDRMFTIFGTDLARFQENLPQIIAHLESVGFKYISEEHLSARYDGIGMKGTENWTWFTRFFDYL